METSLIFSICVPTRNRSETLKGCLKTLCHQDFESYEILVSDNSDKEYQIQNAQIIDELSNPKIKYYAHETVLSMRENFEFIIGKTRGEFVCTLGDDDGMVVDCLNYVYEMIQKHNVEYIKSRTPFYIWPTDKNSTGQLTMPICNLVLWVDSESMLKNVCNFYNSCFDLPMIYYGFLSRKIIDKIISLQGSFFADCSSVDIYSGIMTTLFIDKYLLIDQPIFITGQSVKSNGMHYLRNNNNQVVIEYIKQHNISETYKKFNIPAITYDLGINIWMQLEECKRNFSNFPVIKFNSDLIFLNYLSLMNPNECKEDHFINQFLEVAPNKEKLLEYIRIHQHETKLNNRVVSYLYYMLYESNRNVILNQESLKDVYAASLAIKKIIESRDKNELIDFGIKVEPKLNLKDCLKFSFYKFFLIKILRRIIIKLNHL
jgi:glycosyltransferase involved in cell wall biosynthesis